jgi:redox-sensitive bicupin YhaK (pirin superfamily)
MATTRKVAATFKAQDTLEGAGVRLRRGFSNFEAAQFDPFLLFDDFSSDIPEHYLAGFPWHPHRGMETVTYILDGAVRHKDSLGNEGVIESGAVQWMTAGSGIIHEEMPESVHGIRGFQLWVNLPRERKMAKPRYQDLKGKVIPEVTLARGARARVVSGTLAEVAGPLQSIATNPLYADISLEANAAVEIPVTNGHTAFVYIIEGALASEATEPSFYAPANILLFTREGDTLALRAGSQEARFLLIAGAPLNEPIAWHGPIVMNTDDELRQAFLDLREGTFIRSS